MTGCQVFLVLLIRFQGLRLKAVLNSLSPLVGSRELPEPCGFHKCNILGRICMCLGVCAYCSNVTRDYTHNKSNIFVMPFCCAATMALVQVGQCKSNFEVSSSINQREVQNLSAHVGNHKVQYHKCVRTYQTARVFFKPYLWSASPPIPIGNKHKHSYLSHSQESGRKITRAAEKPNSQALELREPVKDKVSDPGRTAFSLIHPVLMDRRFGSCMCW